MNEKMFIKFLENHGYEFCDEDGVIYSSETVIDHYKNENMAFANLIAIVELSMDKLSYVSKEHFSISEEIVNNIIQEINEHPRKYEIALKNFGALKWVL